MYCEATLPAAHAVLAVGPRAQFDGQERPHVPLGLPGNEAGPSLRRQHRLLAAPRRLVKVHSCGARGLTQGRAPLLSLYFHACLPLTFWPVALAAPGLGCR